MVALVVKALARVVVVVVDAVAVAVAVVIDVVVAISVVLDVAASAAYAASPIPRPPGSPPGATYAFPPPIALAPLADDDTNHQLVEHAYVSVVEEHAILDPRSNIGLLRFGSKLSRCVKLCP